MSKKQLTIVSDSVALYVHIPFCTSKCRYCSFYSEPIDRHNPAALVDALIAEMAGYDLGQKVHTVYIGGGSPSSLAQEQLIHLIDEIISKFSNIKEFTIEVNPGQIDEKLLVQLRKAGINRLSIGAQTFNQTELDFLGRGYKVENINCAVRSAKRAGFNNISIDLIFAIPGSNIASWKRSLQSAVDLGVQHISAYSLTYEKGTELQRDIETNKIKAVDEDTDRQMYELTIDELARGGFEHYEISNFAESRFECQHNLTYWANQPYIGIGPSAASYYNGRRTANIADIDGYIKAVNSGESIIAQSQTPDTTEIACETAVLNLRRWCGIDLQQFQKQTGFDAAKLFAEPVERYLKLGLLKREAGRIFLTREALPIADSVLCDFSAV